MSLQGNSSNSFMDFMHYQWIFNEADRDEKTDKKAADHQVSGSDTQYPAQARKRAVNRF